MIYTKSMLSRYNQYLLIGAEGERSPAGLAGQVRPRRRSRGGSPPAPRSRPPGAEIL
jgi:hypothetical protein